MRQRSWGSFWRHAAPVLPLSFFFLSPFLSVTAVHGQTTQPFLFAGTYDSSSKTTGSATLVCDGSTGALSLLCNTVVSFKDACYPAAIDPTGNFLFGPCGEGQRVPPRHCSSVRFS